MAISKIKTGSITDSAITEAKLGSNAVTTGKISDGTIVNADVSPSAAIVASKLVVCTAQQETNAFNISLLGFKMAVNEGLTVFNLVDGIVDEFHDESGTDEAEGSNDTYCATGDHYINSTSGSGEGTPYSAGFTTSAVTESDTSTAGTNPGFGSGTFGSFTVPTGVSSSTLFAWGSGGGAYSGPGSPKQSTGGGGGFATGALAVTASQTVRVIVGEGGEAGNERGLGGGGSNPNGSLPAPSSTGSNGGGLSGIFNSCVPATIDPVGSANGGAPTAFLVAGSGGGGGHMNNPSSGIAPRTGGAGGGTTGQKGATTTFSVSSGDDNGGGGDQEQGGQAGFGSPNPGQNGGLFFGGNSNPDDNAGGGGSGYYGGGGATSNGSPQNTRTGGGGSSYFAHPQITSGSTEAGCQAEGGGTANPNYVASTNEGPALNPDGENGGVQASGEDGYVLITGSASATTLSTTIVSNAFTASSVPTTSRIVVFEEDVATPTLNTDIIASISRDGGSNFTTATLSDSGYVTGSSGQRILTGQATISGQPSGQSMRWKLALANNAIKIHGVSLQWA